MVKMGKLLSENCSSATLNSAKISSLRHFFSIEERYESYALKVSSKLMNYQGTNNCKMPKTFLEPLFRP